ncbi:MAG: hypothetical protein GY793_12095 [Proteobacteria bacterium]|nr:hypothetical protein [Pseudomonadota bacterium]
MLKKVLLMMITANLLFSCAAHLASTGEKSPEINVFKKGASRFDIESEVGPPLDFKDLKNGKSLAVYKFKTGTDPSMPRATFWLASDIFFVFLPEIIGIPYELLQATEHKLTVVYDSNYVATKIEQIKI